MNKNQFQSILNKGIATPVALLIVFLAAVIAGAGILAYQHFQITEKEVEAPKEIVPEKKAEESEEPYIKVLSPNGGEVWKIGSTHTIRWVTHNMPSINKIAIHIRRISSSSSPRHGQEFDPIIFTNLENNGEKDWTILSPDRLSDMYPEGNYIIEAMSYDPTFVITKSISDESDNYFKIKR